jgi:SAM-dependent methyltransferase
MAVEVQADNAPYGFDQAWSNERRRLGLIEQLEDPATIGRLVDLGVREGWRCLEIGPGGGSIARWLRDRVGPQGAVVAVDLDTRFVDREPGIKAHTGDILTLDLELGTYDLVHCRAVLHHLAGRQQKALERMHAALRPDGVILATEPYTGPMFDSRTPAWLAAAHALHAAMPGADYTWAPTLAASLQAAGFARVAGHADADVVHGATPLAELLALTFEAIRPRVPNGADIDHALELLNNPESCEPGIVWYTATGRRRPH